MTVRVETMALGWMLLSWLAAPLLSRFWVRTWKGAPLIWPAPLGPPPEPALFVQYADCARCPPQARRTEQSAAQVPVSNVRTMSALLLPEPAAWCAIPVPPEPEHV